MIKITVKTSRCKITGDYPKEEIDKVLSAYQTGYQYSPQFRRRRANGERAWDGKIHLLSRATDSFPTGVLDLVYDTLVNLGYKVELEYSDDIKNLKDDFPVLLVPAVVGKYELRDYQIASISAFIHSKNLLPYRGIIQAGTGSGKTVTAIALASMFNTPTLFLVKGRSLKDQSLGVFEEALGKDKVGVIDAQKWEPKLITVASVDTLASRLENLDTMDLVRAYLNTIKFVVADEVHRGTSQRYKDVLNNCPAPIRLGLSGTPNKGYLDKDLLLHATCGTVIHKVTAPELQESGRLSKAELHSIIIGTPKLESLGWREAQDVLIINNADRHMVISHLVKKEFDEGKFILVMCGNSIPLTDQLYQAIVDEIGNAKLARKVTGQSPTDYVNKTFQLMRDKKLQVIVTTVIADEGIDIPEINSLFIVNGGKSFVRAIQRIGRGLRIKSDGSSLKVYDVCDKTNPYLKKHAVKRIEHYASEQLFSDSYVIDGDQILKELKA